MIRGGVRLKSDPLSLNPLGWPLRYTRLVIRGFIDSVRRNHALEHATIAVLLSKHGPTRVVGRASRDGFYIYGKVTAERLREFADEALMRLQRGEAHLAVSPLCGTNIAVAGVLAGVGSYAALSRKQFGGLPGAIVASIVAVIASQPLGRLVQKNYTTLADLGGVRIVGVEPLGRGLSNVHKVRTAAI